MSKKISLVCNEKKTDACKYVFKLPYVGNPSLILKKKLKKLFKQKNVDICIVFSSFKVGQYFSLKDKSDSILRSSLVYKFKCLDDPSCSYIGKTKRYLNKRITEHLKPGSAIHSHVQSCNSCNSENLNTSFSKIDQGKNDFDLKILEALHITENRPTLNKQLVNEGGSFKLRIF